jgi:hypothetical protein
MSQPTWQTPPGSLGTIPEGVFFQQPLLATVPANPIPANCVGTSSVNNAITCDTTQDVVPGLAVNFTGVPFGGLEQNRVYFVLQVIDSTRFTITASPGSVSPIPLTTAAGVMVAQFFQRVFYRLQAGTTPQGVQISDTGVISGVPFSVASVQGVPTEVSSDVTSKFTVRAYTVTTVNSATVIDRISDRTFSITVSGNDVPEFVTPAGNIASYYDGDQVDLLVQYTNVDPDDVILVRLVRGALPPGLTLSADGRIYGYIKPAPNQDEPPGYDLTPIDIPPYDFVSRAISKNYQFTLEITDGKSSNLRTFEIFVYNREDLTGDDTYITGDNTFVTADQTPVRAPFLLNAEPSNIGTIRGANNFAYRFVGQDYDDDRVEYKILVNEGFGLPPGLELDPYSGWYYGYVPDVGVTENNYSFFIQVRSRSIVVSETSSGTNSIICDNTVRSDFYVGAALEFEGAVIGGLATNTVYYVSNIVSNTEFTVSLSLGGPEVVLTSELASDLLLAVPQDISSSQLYPFTITITGAIDREVIWLTNPDLGMIENGATSTLKVEAVNRGGVPLFYQLASGAFNELPQGLTLLPTGEIAGQVTFNTFSIDQGATTIDRSQSVVSGIQETTFDSTFVFTVNAYAEDNQQALFKVSAVKVLNGGSGYVSAPTITFNEPVGAGAIQALANVIVSGGSVSAVDVTNSGAEYTSVATYTLTGPGTNADLQVVMQQTGFRRIISVFRTFTVRVMRVYNKPFQNLYVVAMPPQDDRLLLDQLLSNQSIFVPDYIYRPDDPNFGLSSSVKYEHAVGLAPETLDVYVQSLELNHYWKNLVLGDIKTAQARDSNGNVIYEVVYSEIVDDLVNSDGESVSKIVTTPYAFFNPEPPPELINSVYPNSLVNMRDQVIDVVGQISNKLPLWMTSKQQDGSVLGFVPAWVICYTKPGRGQQIAYYIDTQFGTQLNRIDFKVDRYIVDGSLTRNWDPATQQWTPEPNLTTFDRVNTTGYNDLGVVSACTELAFTDVDNRTIDDINSLGGLDGQTWIAVPGQTPPQGTRVTITNGSKIVFVRQENFSRYVDPSDAFTNNINGYDELEFDLAGISVSLGSFDYGKVIPGGSTSQCTETIASTDLVLCSSTLGMRANNKVWFTGSTFGNIQSTASGGIVQVYYVNQVASVSAVSSNAATDRLTLSSTADLAINDEVWFEAPVDRVIVQVSSVDNKVNVGNTSGLLANMRVTLTGAIGNLLPYTPDSPTVYYVKTIVNATEITLSSTAGGSTIDPGTDSGAVICNIGGAIGGLFALQGNGLPRPYYIKDIIGNTVELSNSPGGALVELITESGFVTVYRNAFSVYTLTNPGQPVALSNATGIMTVNWGNDRMAIWTVTVGIDNIIRLSLDQETVSNDFVTSSQGQKYSAGTYLYRPPEAQQSLTRINWQPLIAATTVISDETTFDQGSVQWVDPVDIYNPTSSNDKYLVFPKQNILE